MLRRTLSCLHSVSSAVLVITIAIVVFLSKETCFLSGTVMWNGNIFIEQLFLCAEVSHLVWLIFGWCSNSL